MSYSADLDLAINLANALDEITFPATQQEWEVFTKADDSPVTEIDRRAEEKAREILAQHRPHDAIVGEEFPDSGSGNRRWIIDPIDGTKNFIRGVPIWASLIALADGDEIVVGVVSAPALGRRWHAATGQGAWVTTSVSGQELPARRIHVSAVTELADASLSLASLGGWEQAGALDQVLQLPSGFPVQL